MAEFTRDGKRYTFARETSHFSKVEHDGLNIDITATDDFDELLNHGLGQNVIYGASDLPSTLKQIVDANIDRQAILAFNPSKYRHLSKDVVLFYNKLKMVLWNNSQDMQVPRFESYLHEFAAQLFYCAELEDGYNLTMVPCNLELIVDQQRFAAYADREGRRGTKTIWILDKDKHRYDTRYKDGIIQLVGCLIAAAQRNKANLLNNRPAKLIGTLIKVWTFKQTFMNYMRYKHRDVKYKWTSDYSPFKKLGYDVQFINVCKVCYREGKYGCCPDYNAANRSRRYIIKDLKCVIVPTYAHD